MAHPLLKYSNFKLSIPTYSGTSTRNPDTGEWERNSVISEYRAIVKVDDKRTYYQTGKDTSVLFLRGNLTDPKELPNELELASINASLYDPHRETWIEGEFIFDLTMQPPFKIVSKILGNGFTGQFTAALWN